ncbi:hypothetical protein [Streptomyces sp. NPDC002491]
MIAHVSTRAVGDRLAWFPHLPASDGRLRGRRRLPPGWMTELAATNGLRATPASIRPWLFFPGSWDTATYKNTSYGVPFIADTSVIYYRSDITAKANVVVFATMTSVA